MAEVKVTRENLVNALNALKKGKADYEESVRKIQGIVDDITGGKVGGDVGMHVKEACETHVKSLNAGKTTYQEGIDTFEKAITGFDNETEALGKDVMNAQAH